VAQAASAAPAAPGHADGGDGEVAATIAAPADGAAADAQRSRGSAEVVYERLRSAIINGELAQAAVLSQVELARHFGVSRTPLREALRMLQAEGFVNAQLNRKVRVAAFSVEDLEQLYAARIVLEALGVSLSVPQMTDPDFADLHASLDEMEDDAARRDLDAWERHHTEFHGRLVAYASDRTIAMIRQLSDGARRYRRVYISEGPGAWGTTAVEHRAIVAACEARDPRAAASELARHFARTALTVIAMVDPSHDPAPVRAALALVAPEGQDGR
jgi:DNA-binding GntR family transcriptional regulator